MKIHVTQKHIERGQAGSANGCAVALALEEQLPTYEAFVCWSDLSLYPLIGYEIVRCENSKDLYRFIQRFDAYKRLWKWVQLLFPMKEFTFDLPLPERVRNVITSVVPYNENQPALTD